MRILLYNPDNGVTRNFMPHLWMFRLHFDEDAGRKRRIIKRGYISSASARITHLTRHVSQKGTRSRMLNMHNSLAEQAAKEMN